MPDAVDRDYVCFHGVKNAIGAVDRLAYRDTHGACFGREAMLEWKTRSELILLRIELRHRFAASGASCAM